MRSFSDLNDRELLALAISLEDESRRIYSDYVEGLESTDRMEAERLARVRAEKAGQAERLLALHRDLFGEHVTLLRRQDVKGLLRLHPVWKRRPLDPAAARAQAELLALETERLYQAAAARARSQRVRDIFSELASVERSHGHEVADSAAPVPEDEHATASHRLFLLQVVQPAVLCTMDGAIWVLAPLFAAAVATQSSATTFLVGVAASVGAGISMGIAQALEDDGSLTGSLRPWIRGAIAGAMTTLGSLPPVLAFRIDDLRGAVAVAALVVLLQLAGITRFRERYLDAPRWPALLQVVGGGLLAVLAGVAVGSL
jgi:rubrerythrin